MPTKARYTSRKQAEEGSHTPIESIKEANGSNTTSQHGLLQSARNFFRQRFNRPFARDERMRDARDTCLGAITRKLPHTIAQHFTVAKLLADG